MLTRFLILALSLVAGAASAQDPWQGRRAAFFGVTFLDTSAEGEINGPRDDETARVAMVEAQIADALRDKGLTVVDLAPVAPELHLISNPADCSGCDVRMAGRLRADYAVVSEVQKVSNLILSINVVIREAPSGSVIRARAVDIRGNTDDSWRRGIDYVLEHGIFPD